MKKIYKVWNILLLSEKKILVFLVLIRIIGMCLEVLGIALIIPLISVLLKQNTEFFNVDIFAFLDYRNQLDHTTLIVLFIIFVFLIKNLFLMFVAWSDSKFSYFVSARVSNDLFKGYINLPYHFYLTRNTSKLIYNTTTATDLYRHTLNHIAVLTSELFVLIGLSTFLIFVEPFGFICAALLIGLISIMYYKLNKKKNTEWGKLTQLHQKLRIKNLMQGFGSVKDIIISGLQNFFVKTYEIHSTEIAKTAQKHTVVNQFPKYILEFFGVTGILSLLVILKYKMNSAEDIIIIVGVFAAASFRLMPSANRILNSLQGLRFSIATVDNLSNEFGLLSKQSTLTNKNVYVKNQKNYLSDFKEFHLLNVSYKYPNTEKDILKNISLTLNKGEMLGLFGKTGSGKSTLVDIITGLLNLDKGKIIIDQKKFDKIPIFWQRNIGYVPQNIYLLDDSLKKNIALGVNAKNVDETRINEVINLSNLKNLINMLSSGLDTDVGERGARISGGEKQRVGIARALYKNPQILIFDEATNALDLKTEELIMSSIKRLQKEKAILIISHKKRTLGFCNRVVELENGVLKEHTD